MNVINKAHRPAPPPSTARKDDPINVNFEERAKRLLREAMDAKGMTVAELTDRLKDIGVTISRGGVANKISRGGFSVAFFLQCIEALDLKVQVATEGAGGIVWLVPNGLGPAE